MVGFGRKAFIGGALALCLEWGTGRLAAQSAAEQVYDDAKVIRRIAEIAGRDVPRDLIDKIATQDIELLRGRRVDGTYEFAHYEKDEAGRKTQDFTVGSEGRLSSGQVSGQFVFRLSIDSQSRRYVVRRNQRAFIDKVELETTTIDGKLTTETVPVGLWLEPGARKTIDFPEVMRKAKAIVYAKTDDKSGPASLDLSLIEARVVDNFDSPWFAAVQNAKLIRETVKKGDSKNFLTVASMLQSSLQDKIQTAPRPSQIAPATQVTPTALTVQPAAAKTPELERTPDVEIYLELQNIEDLLTGTEAERREGMDRLHQLARKLRSTR